MNNSEIVVSLDIGTSSVKVIVGEMVNGALNIIGVGNVKSKGLKKGLIVDIDETVHSIKKAVEKAERMVGFAIEKVVVGIPSNHIQIQDCHGVVAVAGENRQIREITDEDIARVIDAAQFISIPPDREIIDIIPKQFVVDGNDEISDPRGMEGVRLEMDGVIITTSRTFLHNILRCVERAGLEISTICLQALSAGTISLSKDERDLGVALIDIGGGSTTVSYFKDGFLKGTSALLVGGDHITKDLSIVLRTPFEEAEKAKITHGHAFYEDASQDVTFTVPIIGSDQVKHCNQLEITEIIEARLEEMLYLIQDELRSIGVRELPGGYVFTGGVSELQGYVDLAQVILRNNVRVAKPDYIGVREPQYTTAVGLIQFAYETAKLKGLQIGSTTSNADVYESKPNKKVTQAQAQQQKRQNPDEKLTKKVKKIFGYFFE
ncbi:cell division protein FtsA [Bacillus sp. HMF5848]|uniref:cell division protein FtsA n=1 Tax=Bacillus sp. HMF5848 TaxID=2495421 RepID=UPI000F769422|nr:cell division protein FtsA [Bacillus sp. HMF5848]RSK26946.1 cell division protein FtsA [Bacillus sp. HMF5848]